MTGARPGLTHDARRSFLILAAAWCLLTIALPGLVVALMGDRIPDPFPLGWDAEGVATQLAPLVRVWTAPAVVSAIIAVTLVALGLASRALRMAAELAMAFTTVFGVGGAGPLIAQVDNGAAPDDLGIGLAGWLVGCAAAVGLWRTLQMRRAYPWVGARSSGATGSTTPAAGPSWVGRTRTSRTAVIVSCMAYVVLAAIVAIPVLVHRLWVAGATMLALGVVIGLLLFGILRPTVIIDGSGVRIRSYGIVWIRIPLAAIKRAKAVHVEFPEFNGPGLGTHVSGHASGLVTSSGSSVRLRLMGKRWFHVTVDPARDVAAVVNSLVHREASSLGVG